MGLSKCLDTFISFTRYSVTREQQVDEQQATHWQAARWCITYQWGIQESSRSATYSVIIISLASRNCQWAILWRAELTGELSLLLKLHCIIERTYPAVHVVSAVALLENIWLFTSNQQCLFSVTSLSLDSSATNWRVQRAITIRGMSGRRWAMDIIRTTLTSQQAFSA